MFERLLSKFLGREKLARRIQRCNPALINPEHKFGKWTFGAPRDHSWAVSTAWIGSPLILSLISGMQAKSILFRLDQDITRRLETAAWLDWQDARIE
jgi:hypothetical protein